MSAGYISSVGLGEAGLPVGRRGQALRGAWLACGCTVHAGCFSPAGYTAPYLTVFSENSVDVFDVRRAEWVQTVPLKKVKVSPQHGWHGGAYRGLTSVLSASGKTPESRRLLVPLWYREGPPDLPQEPVGR